MDSEEMTLEQVESGLGLLFRKVLVDMADIDESDFSGMSFDTWKGGYLITLTPLVGASYKHYISTSRRAILDRMMDRVFMSM